MQKCELCHHNLENEMFCKNCGHESQFIDLQISKNMVYTKDQKQISYIKALQSQMTQKECEQNTQQNFLSEELIIRQIQKILLQLGNEVFDKLNIQEQKKQQITYQLSEIWTKYIQLLKSNKIEFLRQKQQQKLKILESSFLKQDFILIKNELQQIIQCKQLELIEDKKEIRSFRKVKKTKKYKFKLYNLFLKSQLEKPITYLLFFQSCNELYQNLQEENQQQFLLSVFDEFTEIAYKNRNQTSSIKKNFWKQKIYQKFKEQILLSIRKFYQKYTNIDYQIFLYLINLFCSVSNSNEILIFIQPQQLATNEITAILTQMENKSCYQFLIKFFQLYLTKIDCYIQLNNNEEQLFQKINKKYFSKIQFDIQFLPIFLFISFLLSGIPIGIQFLLSIIYDMNSKYRTKQQKLSQQYNKIFNLKIINVLQPNEFFKMSNFIFKVLKLHYQKLQYYQLISQYLENILMEIKMNQKNLHQFLIYYFKISINKSVRKKYPVSIEPLAAASITSFIMTLSNYKYNSNLDQNLDIENLLLYIPENIEVIKNNMLQLLKNQNSKFINKHPLQLQFDQCMNITSYINSQQQSDLQLKFQNIKDIEIQDNEFQLILSYLENCKQSNNEINPTIEMLYYIFFNYFCLYLGVQGSYFQKIIKIFL